jgi:hypothetical protein
MENPTHPRPIPDNISNLLTDGRGWGRKEADHVENPTHPRPSLSRKMEVFNFPRPFHPSRLGKFQCTCQQDTDDLKRKPTPTMTDLPWTIWKRRLCPWPIREMEVTIYLLPLYHWEDGGGGGSTQYEKYDPALGRSAVSYTQYKSWNKNKSE